MCSWFDCKSVYIFHLLKASEVDKSNFFESLTRLLQTLWVFEVIKSLVLLLTQSAFRAFSANLWKALRLLISSLHVLLATIFLRLDSSFKNTTWYLVIIFNVSIWNCCCSCFFWCPSNSSCFWCSFCSIIVLFFRNVLDGSIILHNLSLQCLNIYNTFGTIVSFHFKLV